MKLVTIEKGCNCKNVRNNHRIVCKKTYNVMTTYRIFQNACITGTALGTPPGGGGPRLSVTPPQRVVFSSQVGTVLACAVEGTPRPTISWTTRDGRALVAQPPYLDIMSNGSLAVHPFPPERYRADVHAATIMCRASNNFGTVVSPPIVLHAVVWQDFTVRAEGARASVGGAALLRCLVPTHLAPHVTPTAWETPTHTVYPSPTPEGRYHMVPGSGDLLVTGVTRQDSHASFSCRVRDKLAGHTVSSQNPAKIIIEESGEASRPVVQEKRRAETVQEGDVLAVPCIASGTPTPSVRWNSYSHHGPVGGMSGGLGGLAGGAGSTHTALGGVVLFVDRLQLRQPRTFTCTANNSLGVDQMSLEVTVEPRLTASVSPPMVKGDLGGSVSFTCTSSDTTAVITWYHDGVQVLGNSRVVTAVRQLIVSPVTRDDPGMYQCMASRGGKTVQAAAQLVLGDSSPVLHYRFIEQTIQPGPSVSLKCSASGSPTPTLQWTLDGFPLTRSDRVVIGEFVGSRGDVVSHVNISRTRVEDGGLYSCLASNRAGEDNHAARLNIYGSPVARAVPAVTAVAGKEFKLRCPVAGFPLDKVVWSKNGNPIGDESLERRVTSDGALHLPNVKRPQDAGLYTCTASNKQGHASTGTAQVTVLVPPRIEPFSFQDGLSEGKRTRVICGVSQGDPPLTLTWLKDGQRLPLVGLPNVQVKGIDDFSSVLSINALSSVHSGQYMCTARNAASAVHYTAALQVNVPPTWVVEPSDARAGRGQALIVDCVARGHPEPTVVWKKKVGMGDDAYRSVQVVSPQVAQLANGSLYIARADPHHAGTYLCHASNSVTSLSKAVTISVNSPPYFSAGERTVGVRAGEQAVLKCLVRGDPPITVTWSHRSRPIHPTQRYSESVTGGAAEGDMSAELVVSGTTKHDSGPYTCTALNAHGRNTLTFQLEVHEPPSPPRGLRVMEGSSRFARISWSSPEPTPASYVVQFRKSSEPWSGAREIRTSSSVTGGVEVAPLEPSVRYVIRVVAVNHLGRSQPSEELLLTAAPERPAGAPREVHASALGPRRLRVQWKPPQPDLTHGVLLGYYLGYAPASQSLRSTASIQYNFTEIEVVHGGRVVTQEGLQEAEVGSLKPHTEYQVVVQAFNSEGAGPLSLPVTVSTGEDEPGGPPRDVRCVGLSWDSVQVSWVPPENHLLNGVLRGYKLQYEQWDGWDDAARETQTTAQTTVVTGLEAATNYSVRIKAFTAPGDGPWSQPIRCTTGEDVPGRPQSVRGVVSGSGAFILAWAPPARPGGYIVSYTVTWRVLGTSRGAGRGREGVTTVAGTESWVQVEGVLGSMVEAEVVAATRVGEGPAASTRVTLTNTVPAAIYSPGGVVTTPWGRDVTLSCGHVGQPRPRLVWSHQGRPITSSAEGRLMRGDGGLVIQEARRQDSGNYTCSTTNVHGSDQVTYLLKVLVAPSAPLVLASSSTERSVQVQWKQGDTGGAPITTYTLYYRKDHGAWAQMGLHRHASKHTLKNLDCGSRYHLYMIAHNAVGSSPASSTIVVRTLGSPPRPPPVAQFLRPNSTSVTLYPHLWEARGCPITHMVFEYRQQESTQWVQVSSGDRSERRVVVTSLTPATAYALRVTAVTSAGSSSHTYSFSTLTSTGEVPPVWANAGSAPKWLSVRVLLPLVTSIVALASSLGLVCYCVKRKSVRSDSEGGSGREGGGGGGGPGGGTAARDNKHNLAQRERYYATIRKAAPRESDRIPESADDIYPYATFQLPDPPPPNQGHIPVYQLYQARSDGTSDNYAEVSRRGSRHSRGRSRSRSRGRGVSESGEDYETQGSDTETEHGGASSRTESSNHLEETTTIREHLVSYARGGPNKDQRDAVYSRNAQREPAVPPQRIHHNLLYHAESSTSPEPSPTTERKSFPRRTKARSRVKEPESGGGGAPSVPPPSYPGVGGVPASHGPRVNFTSGVLGNRGGLGGGGGGGGGGGAGGIVGGGGSGNVVINGSPTKPGIPGKGLGITTGELPEVSEAECDRELLPPPRRYSDARHQKRPLDYSIAV